MTHKHLIAVTLESVIGQLLTAKAHMHKLEDADYSDTYWHAVGACVAAIAFGCEDEFRELFPERMNVYNELKSVLEIEEC